MLVACRAIEDCQGSRDSDPRAGEDSQASQTYRRLVSVPVGDRGSTPTQCEIAIS